MARDSVRGIGGECCEMILMVMRAPDVCYTFGACVGSEFSHFFLHQCSAGGYVPSGLRHIVLIDVYYSMLITIDV